MMVSLKQYVVNITPIKVIELYEYTAPAIEKLKESEAFRNWKRIKGLKERIKDWP